MGLNLRSNKRYNGRIKNSPKHNDDFLGLSIESDVPVFLTRIEGPDTFQAYQRLSIRMIFIFLAISDDTCDTEI